jgi:UDP-N-acetylmuramyl pentapeptide phosphotransferase/UDP-N-acetylglucosamine-1-phosphate transferase
MLVAIIPIAIFGIKEDLYHNVKPINRFISLLFSSLLFLWLYRGFLPQLNELPLVKYLVFFQVGNIFFYVLCAAGIANGMNLLDGVNGLCAAVALSILGALLFLSYKTNDTVILELVFSIILVIIPFLFINYPYGRIFLGDLGAYSLGLILSMLTIILFGRHPELSPWGAALILIYPTIEALFSLSRRAIKGISIYQPDSAHLHLKIFHFFRYRPHYKKIANALVTPVLSGLWLFPLLAITWIYQKPLFILIAIILFIAFYGLLYAVVPNTQKNS